MNKQIVINLSIPNNNYNIEKEYGYVFVPFAWEISYHTINYKNDSIVIKFANKIKVEVLKEGHITNIDDGKVNNIMVLTGYALTWGKYYIVNTLDPCTHVKGLLLHGKLLSHVNVIKLTNFPISHLYLLSKNTDMKYCNYIIFPILNHYNFKDSESNNEKFEEQFKKLVNTIYGITPTVIPYGIDSTVV